MESVLWYVLPLAIAVALSIFPVLAAVLLLLSSDPTKASIGYASGWSLGLVVLVTTFAVGAQLIPKDFTEAIPSWVHYVEIVVGAFLIVEGMVAAFHQHRRAQTAEIPQWLQEFSTVSPRRAFAFGAFMNIRPKNLALTLAAGIPIGMAPITLIERCVSVLLFTVVGVSTVVGLVLAYLLAPLRIHPMLSALSAWLVSNASKVLRLTVILIGVLLMTIGITTLNAGS